MKRSREKSLGTLILLLVVACHPMQTGCCCAGFRWSSSSSGEFDLDEHGNIAPPNPFSREGAEVDQERPGPEPGARARRFSSSYVPSGQSWATKETTIIRDNEAVNFVPSSFHVSRDGRHHAHIMKVEGVQRFVIDGKAVKHEGLAVPTPFRWSADGKHWLATVRFTNDNDYDYDDTIEFVYDGNRKKEITSRDQLLPFLSDDGRHWGWVQLEYLNQNQTYYLRIDGKQVHSVTFTTNHYQPYVVHTGPSSFHWAAVGLEQVVVDGKPFKAYEYNWDYNTNSSRHRTTFRFSDDGSSWGFIAKQGPFSFAVVNGKELRRYDDAGGLVLSPNGQRHAYWGHQIANSATGKGEKWFLVVDGSEYEAAAQVHSFVFSPDSSRWACIDGDSLLSGESSAPERAEGKAVAQSPVFSPDSEHLAYVATVDTSYEEQSKGAPYTWFNAVLDGTMQKKYGWMSSRLVFSPNSRNLAYVARDKDGVNPYVVVNNVEGAPLPELLFGPDQQPILAFSPDSQSLAYVAKSDAHWRVVLDGAVRTAYDEIAPEGSRIGFTPDGHFTYIGLREGTYYWVSETPN